MAPSKVLGIAVRCAACSNAFGLDENRYYVLVEGETHGHVCHKCLGSLDPRSIPTSTMREQAEAEGFDGETAFLLDDESSFVDRVKDLAFSTGGPVQLLAELARDLEEGGDLVGVEFHRDATGRIDGFALIDATEMAI